MAHYDWPWAEAKDHHLDDLQVGSYEIPLYGSVGSFRVIPPFWERQNLIGTVRGYSVNSPNWDFGFVPENDWNVNIDPVEAQQAFVDPLVVNAFPDSDPDWITAEDGRHLVQTELNPSGKFLLQYCEKSTEGLICRKAFEPWLPIDLFEGGTSRLVTDRKQVGVYGPYVGDYGHGGRPEIHPFDAIWWQEQPDVWRFGVFWDDSKRFGSTWSVAPREITLHFPYTLTVVPGQTSYLYYQVSDESTFNVLKNGGSTEGDGVKALQLTTGGGGRVDIQVSELHNDMQRVSLAEQRRCGDTLFLLLDVAVAVDKDGVYYGQLRIARQSGPGAPPALAPTAAAKPAAPEPRIGFKLNGLNGPFVLSEGSRKQLAFSYDLEAMPVGFKAVTAAWAWQRLPQGAQPSGPASLPTTISRLQYTLRAGEPGAKLRASVATDQGQRAGTLELEGFTLWAQAGMIADRQALAALPNVPTNLQTARVNVPIGSLLVASAGQALPLSNPGAMVPVETQNIVVLQAQPSYAPIRNGKVYGEEENELAERMNEIIFGSEGDARAERARLYGDAQPFTFSWDLRVSTATCPPAGVSPSRTWTLANCGAFRPARGSSTMVRSTRTPSSRSACW